MVNNFMKIRMIDTQTESSELRVPTRCRPVVTPAGIFISVRAASNYYGWVDSHTVLKRVGYKKRKFPGWSYI